MLKKRKADFTVRYSSQYTNVNDKYRRCHLKITPKQEGAA